MANKIILAHQRPARLGALKDTDTENKDKLFMTRSEVLAKRIQLSDNRIARIGTVKDDEFRAWMLGLIEAQGFSNPEVRTIYAVCGTEILDECARWDLVNRLYRIRAFRKLMFVVEGK